jgi:6-phospho-beta-glucosidase
MGVEGEHRFIGEDGQVKDDYRIDFIRGHLEWIHTALAGVSLPGLSPVDLYR